MQPQSGPEQAGSIRTSSAQVSIVGATKDETVGTVHILGEGHEIQSKGKGSGIAAQFVSPAAPPVSANTTGVVADIRLFTKALVNQWQQHGIWGSFYGAGTHKGVQPSILLGIMLVIFIGAQLAALVFVACHAHSSLKMLRNARAPNPQGRSGLRELIPGISWHDCVPYETRQRSNSGHLSQRRAKEGNMHCDEQIFGQMARQGWNTWATKQRNQYTAASSDDGGQAANKARLQDMLAGDRNGAAPSWRNNATKASLAKLQRSTRGDLGAPAEDEAWDSLESTLAVATRRADMNKRIMDLLHQAPKQASLGAMLDSEYDAMVQWDIENDLTPGLTRREARSPTRSPTRSPFPC